MSLIVDLFVELIARDDRDNLKLITAWWKTNLIIICNSSWYDNYRFQTTRTLPISITIIVEKKYYASWKLILKKIEIILVDKNKNENEFFLYQEMNAFGWFITTFLNSHANGSKITVSRKHYDWELDRKFSWNQSRCKVKRRRIWSDISF